MQLSAPFGTMPPLAIAAVLRELEGQRAWPRVAGVATKDLVELGKGTRQGGPGTPSFGTWG